MSFTESSWPADTSEPILDLTVGQLLRNAGAAAPERTALVAGMGDPAARRRWTYAELLADAEAVGRALLARFEPGERVAVWAPNVGEWVLLELGAALAGLTLVTVNPAFTPAETRYVLSQSRSSAVFHADEFRGNPMAATIDDLRAELPELRDAVSLDRHWNDFLAGGDDATSFPTVDPGDAAQIQYTSGTTGFPKGALLHHRGIVTNAHLTALRCQVPEGATWVNPMPLFHTGGCVLGALGSIARRANHVLVWAFDPALVLELVEAEQAYILGGVPTMLLALMEHPEFATRDLSALRVVLSGGSTVPPDVVRHIESSLGARFSIVFGMTELSPVATQTRVDDSAEDKALTIGQPLPQVEAKVIDPATGATQPVGEPGEFCARGYQVMLGYWDNPEATAETIDADGWLHTGDLCTMDERGYFTVTGRLKDMIIRGGENIYPREIEDLLIGHPAVAEVAVLGVADERWGERVCAVVRLAASAAAAPPATAELTAWCRERLAGHKVPREWFTVDGFPLTGSGKIQKFVLRDRVGSGELDAL